MIPRTAKDLRNLWFESPKALFGRFNFQRDEQIDALVALLADNGFPAVVVLGGQPGIGRGFLCDAAAWRAREEGQKVAVWHLDLDGFEPDIENPLTQYVRHLIDQEERQREAAREKGKGAVRSAAKALSKLDLVGQASEMAASLVSLLWQFDEPVTHLAKVLSQPRRGNGIPPRDDPDTLHRFLTELTRDRKLLVHVKDGPQLTSNLRRWLIRETERAPERLLLVISCPLDCSTERAAPEARSIPERFNVQPLDAGEVRALLDQRFHPNAFPSDFVRALMRCWHGWPAAIANKLADMMEEDLLLYEEEVWRLPPAGLEDPRLVDFFSRGLFEKVDKALAILAEEEPELARALRDLLSLSALCGNYIPMDILLEHLQLDKHSAEAAIDWVDDVVVSELDWLQDLGFHVTGFSGHNIYSFKESLIPRVILDQESEVALEMRASALLRFLEQRVPVTRRRWARCFLSIAEHLSTREREPYELSLAWWIGSEAANALQIEIRTAIEREEIDPELIWRVAEETEAWPAYRRLAVLDAYAQATVDEGEAAVAVLPFDRLVAFHLLRAKLLITVARYGDALADGLSALKLVYRDPLKRAESLNLIGLARLHLGDVRAAKDDFEAALVLDEDNLGEEHPNTWLVRENLASTAEALGDLTGAAKLKKQNLEMIERVLGSEHPVALQVRSNLASALRLVGDLTGAKELLEKNVSIQERILGNEHPDTLVSANNLALTLYSIGDLANAKKYLEKNLEIQERLWGAKHPNILVGKDNLALMIRDLGDPVSALELQERNLEIIEDVLGYEHPTTLVARDNLATTLNALNDLTSARKLLELNLEIQERVLGREHPHTLVARDNLAVTLDDAASARKLQEQNLEILERVLGTEHPSTTISTWNLLQTVRRLNDTDAVVHLLGKLRWLLDRDEESIPSARQRKVRQSLLELIKIYRG